ncbi:MAG: hypothetical protein OMM_03489 [Candidatus Magnetoglobus multicellularis str. Araruama]|uniref:Three-Cys-motif partner protein n=1 Tax=Candidatus Magnetoglobus multicellularis str. Araruama TaxID=890399 RepID=A0A1V1P5T0_9BACT|nr:MAG: hypothetical protein OMM_03489 [Candidatus Magnetoglobus multicellularis str. Araruama]
MAKKTFHKEEFDEGTISKLELFKEYFKESFPVFVHSRYFNEILIIDFFAGQGLDVHGVYGTALNILNEISAHCSSIIKNGKKIYLILNDKNEADNLKENAQSFLESCQAKCHNECILKENINFLIRKRDFHEYFNELYPKLRTKNSVAKLFFLDPFNFVIDKKLFHKLIELPSTDFLCFMPSSFLRRFPDEPSFKKYIDSNEIDFKSQKPAHCHRAIADYFQTLIQNEKEYYIGCFSIKKGTNYYGVLFGSNHTLGAEKFQRVCWKKDDVTGEADYNIDSEIVYNKNQNVLFDIPAHKLESFEKKLKNEVTNKIITNDIESYKFALKNRCLVKHASDILKKLMKQGKIQKIQNKK